MECLRCVYEFGKHSFVCAASMCWTCSSWQTSCTSTHADSCKYLRCMKMTTIVWEETWHFCLLPASVSPLSPLKPSRHSLCHPPMSIFTFVSGVGSLWLRDETDCSSALRTACSCSRRERQDLTPLTLPCCPTATADWVAERGSPDSCAVCSWTGKKSQTADSFDRWLWNGACFLWLSSTINSFLVFTCPAENNTSRARSWGWHRHSERKPWATQTDVSGD